MSRLTMQLLNDPHLMAIAHQARREVELEATATGARYTRDQVAQRIVELDEWRRRAERAEHLLAGSRRRERELEARLTAQREEPNAE